MKPSPVLVRLSAAALLGAGALVLSSSSRAEIIERVVAKVNGDIVTQSEFEARQLAAVQAAIKKVREEVLRDHVAHCVEHAIKSGNKADQREKVAELMDVLSRLDR